MSGHHFELEAQAGPSRETLPRRLAFGLLACAEHAEQQTHAAAWWQR